MLTSRALVGATALVLVAVGTLAAFLSVIPGSAELPPALGRKEHDALREMQLMMASSSRRCALDALAGLARPDARGRSSVLRTQLRCLRCSAASAASRYSSHHHNCIEDATTEMLKQKGDCESTYTSCIFVCASQTSGAAKAICVIECEQTTANCSSVAEETMEQSMYACAGEEPPDDGGNVQVPSPVLENKYCVGKIDKDAEADPEKDGNGARARTAAGSACLLLYAGLTPPPHPGPVNLLLRRLHLQGSCAQAGMPHGQGAGHALLR